MKDIFVGIFFQHMIKLTFIDYFVDNWWNSY